MTRPVLEHRVPFRMLAKQEELFRSDRDMLLALGGFASGKSSAGALAYMRGVAENPWRPEYGEDRPTSLIVATTLGTIKQSTYKALMRIVPREAILKERKADRAIDWANGHVTRLYGIGGRWDGTDATHILVDEVHTLRIDGDKWEDLIARVRDPRAARKRWIVTGVPVEVGWLRAKIGLPEHYADPTKHYVHMSTYENTSLRPETLRMIEASVGLEDAETLLGGQWRKPQDCVFPEYDAGRHVIGDAGDKNKPVHLSLDVGAQAAVVVAQERRLADGSKALHVVDEAITDDTTSPALLARVFAKGWRLEPKASVVCLDPRAHYDVIAAVKSAIPRDVRILRYQQGQPEYDVSYGLRAIRAALRDATKTVRLTFSNRLPMSRRSLLVALPSYKYNPSGRPHKDNSRDHIIDALRYLVVTVLPLRESAKVALVRL